MKLEITTDLMTAAKSAVAAKYDTLAAARDQFVARLAENIAAQSQPQPADHVRAAINELRIAGNATRGLSEGD